MHLPMDVNPRKLDVKQLSAAVAKLLGCRPRWSEYYGDWTCPCNGMRHAIDSQCSVVADYAGDVRSARRVAEWMERQGMRVPRMTADPIDVCRAALRAWQRRQARRTRQ